MAKITLSILGKTNEPTTGIDAVIARVKGDIKSLETPIKITVDSQGLDAAVTKYKEVKEAEAKASEAAAKLANAEARKTNAETRSAQSAAKLRQEQKNLAQQTQNTASATEHAALTINQLTEKFLNSAKSAEYTKEKAAILYSAYQNLAQQTQNTASAQDTLNQTHALTITRISALTSQIRELTAAYGELSRGGASGASQSNAMIWSRYGDFRDKAIDLEPVEEGAAATSEATARMKDFGNAAKQTSENIKSAAEAADDYTKKVETFKNGEEEADTVAKTYNDTLTKQTTVTQKLNKETGEYEEVERRVVENLKKAPKALSDEERAMNTAAVRAGALSDKYGELIDHQEKVFDGQVIEASNTYRNQLGEVTKVVSKLDGETAKVTVTQRTNSEQMKKQADAAELAAKKNSLLGDSLDRIVAKIVAWQTINAAVAALIRSFTQAVETMKEVDTELTNIQKVSDLTAEEIQKIGDSAYDVASKYGVAAEEYLSAVYTFQKAGLGDSAEQMAELAIKTMLVGDTTDEVATKFLIAANAAWKMGGDVDKLNTLIDQADYLNNNYAVSLEDIAEALPIVASTAAQAGLSVEQTMSAITTIVSQTAQSGTRVGTALRAIIMNLAGETGELEDGFEVTAESIKTLNGIIKEFRPEAIAAAEAAGTIIDPMEAIAALGEAVEAGVLNSGELFDIVSELGGKLRANQLNALVQGQEMYNEALEGTKNAAGTADKEISALMESWEKKTQALNNTWTKFLTNFIDTNFVKDVIESITAIVKALDTGVGKAVIWIGLIGTALAAVTALNPVAQAITAIALSIGLVLDLIGKAKIAHEEELKQIRETYPELYNLRDAIEAVKEAEEDGEDAGAKLDALYEKRGDAIEVYRENQDKLHDNLVRLAQIEKELAAIPKDEGGYYVTKEDADAASALLIEQYQLEEENKNLRESQNELKDSVDEAGIALNGYTPKVEEAAEETNAVADATGRLSENLRTAVGVYKDVDENLSEVVKALKELDDEGVISASTIDSLLEKYPELEEAVTLTSNGYVIERSKLEELINARRTEYQLTINNAANAAREQISALNSEAQAWNMTTEQIKAYLQAKIAALSSASNISNGTINAGAGSKFANLFEGGGVSVYSAEISELRAALAEIEASEKALADFDLAVDTLYGFTDVTSETTTSKSSSSSGTVTDKKLAALKAEVALRESELNLLKAQGATEEELNKKRREIQEALHEQAEYMRSIKSDETDINALSVKWWNLENDILDAEEKIAQVLRDEIAEQMESIADSLEKAKDAMLSPLNEELDALKAAHDLTEERREEEEKILAVREAEIALENAQKERTVRQYNSATGQWEWVANAKTVADAAQSLADAQQELADYYAEKKYQDAVAALEKEIEYTEDAFDAFNAAWEEATEAVKNGAMSIQDAYDYITEAMKSIYDDYGVDLTGVLTDIVAGLGDIKDDILSMLSDAYSEAKAAGDAEGMKEAHDAANAIRAANGEETTNAAMDIAAVSAANSSKTIEDYAADYMAAKARGDAEGMEAANRAANILRGLGNIVTAQEDIDAVKNANTYDVGGILHGKGGIKATTEDEMVLPPDVTRSLLTAEASGGFDALLKHLGIVTSAAKGYVGLGGGNSKNTIGSQHNGDIYEIGGVTLTEQQARGMTVYDLAQMSRNLVLAN